VFAETLEVSYGTQFEYHCIIIQKWSNIYPKPLRCQSVINVAAITRAVYRVAQKSLDALCLTCCQRSLTDYCKIKGGGCREDYVLQCNREERSGLAWFRMGIWEFKGLRVGLERGNLPAMPRWRECHSHTSKL
jgi:hypothetical protein